MSKGLDALLAHYRQHERQSMLVPEMKGADGKPMRVYWQLLTPEERDELFAAGVPDDVDVVIRKAQDADGSPLFSPEDRLKMRKAARSSLVTRLSRAMLDLDGVTEEAVEDARKN